MGQSEEYYRVMSILDANKDKDFVKRILAPRDYPIIDSGNGSYATHKMAWMTTDDGPIIFPTVVHQPTANRLVELPVRDAVKHALRTGEYIRAKDNEEADWFSSKYKAVWDVLGYPKK